MKVQLTLQNQNVWGMEEGLCQALLGMGAVLVCRPVIVLDSSYNVVTPEITSRTLDVAPIKFDVHSLDGFVGMLEKFDTPVIVELHRGEMHIQICNDDGGNDD